MDNVRLAGVVTRTKGQIEMNNARIENASLLTTMKRAKHDERGTITLLRRRLSAAEESTQLLSNQVVHLSSSLALALQRLDSLELRLDKASTRFTELKKACSKNN